MKSFLRVPDTIKLLQPKQVYTLSPADKDRYYDKVIMDILQANPEGVTVTEIQEATHFMGRTIRPHLKGLVARGEATQISRGKLTIYQSSGEIIDKPTAIQSNARLGTVYVVNRVRDYVGNLSYYIQEKELDAYRTLRVKGGISVSSKDIDHFIAELYRTVSKDGTKSK